MTKELAVQALKQLYTNLCTWEYEYDTEANYRYVAAADTILTNLAKQDKEFAAWAVLEDIRVTDLCVPDRPNQT